MEAKWMLSQKPILWNMVNIFQGNKGCKPNGKCKAKVVDLGLEKGGVNYNCSDLVTVLRNVRCLNERRHL
jgi:hypothetical protein